MFLSLYQLCSFPTCSRRCGLRIAWGRTSKKACQGLVAVLHQQPLGGTEEVAGPRRKAQEQVFVFDCVALSHPLAPVPVPCSNLTRVRLGRRFPGFRCACTEELVAPLRMVKEPADLEAMRRAALAADAVFTEVVQRLYPGIPEVEAYRELDRQMRLVGVDGLSFQTSLMSGSREEPFRFGRPSGGPRGRHLTAGSVLAFDYGFVLDGWCSDFGHDLHRGAKPLRGRRLHRARRRRRAGVTGGWALAERHADVRDDRHPL